ncbi:MAG TPA: bifunctional 3-(3-hydroxy-phenyl)propionate/3-hydroxycinnamic acid hydroxylase [Solirubrobacteraceae bacterium]|nr:bifunctional 3-(3-hydroxy-phenyl)propionate/3-hydroxycinnamic acid hydroxylase [Solirubrobacteraceae bacterium]
MNASGHGFSDVADVAIVGYGPVGQALAVALGEAGYRVACFERFGEIYRLPRAVHLDHEIMRLLDRLGVAGTLEPEMVPIHEYHWYGADGDELMTLRPANPALSGWEPDYLFFQPLLEEALDARARSFPGVTVERGWVAEGLEQDGDGATLTLRRVEEPADGAVVPTDELRRVRARWVVGADGANSFVREALAIPRNDLGFQEQWLVVDVAPYDAEAFDLPDACQWCDPRRPTTQVHSGVGHRRWEFMLLDGERAEDFDADRAWELLAPWVTPDEATLLRHAVYEFRSMVAERVREGRCLIVGDAAHLTPPFLGQGLCSGLRDAANAAWKLDLVLRGLAADALLDTVTEERQPQNDWIISFAVQLGKVLCELDPDAAAERDRTLRAAGPAPEIGLPPLEGSLRRDGDALSGALALQGRVELDGRAGRLDDHTGNGFALIVRDGTGLAALSDAQRAVLDALGVASLRLDAARELDGRTTAWLDEHGAYAVLVRPDLYVFGSAPSAAELPALIDDLRDRLDLRAGATA